VSTLVTYCCKDKRSDSDPIPAIERYCSWRIKYVWRKAQAEDRPMLILSGLLGLVRPETRIRFYDKLLLPQDVGPMVDLVSHQLLWFGVDQVEYFTRDVQCNAEVRPYHDLLAAACQREHVEMVVKSISEAEAIASGSS
jgi:hypothetical protein